MPKDFDKSQFLETFKNEVQERLMNLENGIVKLEKEPGNIDLVKELNREAHSIKGAARMMGFIQIQDIAHKIEDFFAVLSEKNIKFHSKWASHILIMLDLIKEFLGKIISGEKIDADVSGICLECDKIILQKDETVDLTIEKTAISKELKCEKSKTGEDEKCVIEEYIKIPVSRVNKLINLMGELITIKGRSDYGFLLAKNLTDQCSLDSEKIKKEILVFYEQVFSDALRMDAVIKELQESIRNLRLLPASTVFGSYPRLVRDIALSQNKKIEFKMVGEETEIDKKILEEINPALIHILRNSVDHGIEKEGAIILSSYYEGGEVVVKVSDNGRGIDLNAIKEVASKKMNITEDALGKMTDNEVLSLIFLHGFSTSQSITDISGRGIGLDVVKTQIEKLRGRVEVVSSLGQGTAITLRLPLTVAVMQALIVTIRSHFFAFPLFAVLETVKVKKCDLSFIEGKEIVDVRGQPVQVANLGELWGMPFLPEKDRHIKKDDIHLIIASSLGGGIGFVVDEILREEEIYVKSLGGYLGKIKDVEGAAVLSGGEIAVVVDVFSLANTSKEVKLGVALEGGTDRIEGESLKEKKKILIVDDSYMIRELEKKILEDKNYRVETAIDGIDALNKITKVAPDLVITDAQMPNMDGFQMCETLKKNEKYKNIPVIMLTSLDKEEDKTKGTEAGADAYMTKEDFEQSKLLETVSRFAA